MRLSAIIALLLLSACTKPVYTVYYEDENYTKFTTHALKITTPSDHELVLVASRRCEGMTLCTADEIKLAISHEDRFAFLKGQDFSMTADGKEIDLNRRDYSFYYDMAKKAKDSTTGVAQERWLVFIPISDFDALANSKRILMQIGPEQMEIPFDQRNNWRIMIDHKLLIGTMDEEQQRSYGEYSQTPSSEEKRREKFEKKAATEAEEATWKLVKDSDNPEDLKFFLKQYPNSPYSVPARLKLQQLERSSN